MLYNSDKTANLGNKLRRASVDVSKKLLRISKFKGTKQESDFSLPPNCAGFGRIHHFRRNADANWIPDPLPLLPALNYLGLAPADVCLAEVFQLAACNLRCWYCFVDPQLLNADPLYSEFVSADRLLGLMQSEGSPCRIIDLSGGHPGLVPEYELWFLEARKDLGLEKEFFIWVDDNLTTDYMWQHLSEDEIRYMINCPGYARVGCLKGFDQSSFIFNTGASGSLFDNQIEILRNLVNAGFDQYAYVTLTTLDITNLHDRIARLFDKLQAKIHPRFPLRIVPLRIFRFNANSGRYSKEADANQFRVLLEWNNEVERRFTSEERSIPITSVKCNCRTGA